MRKRLESGIGPPIKATARKSDRITLDAEVVMRRASFNNYSVTVHDLSVEGCKVAFVDRPKLDERVWVKFEGLEALEGTVCWVKGTEAGIEFRRPIHPAVFELLLTRLV